LWLDPLSSGWLNAIVGACASDRHQQENSMLAARFIVSILLPLGLFSGSALAGPIWEGVFTAEQVDRGEAAYGQHCFHCHEWNLAGNGDLIPAIGGPEFIALINGVNLADLFAFITDFMPADDPSSVSPEKLVDVLAYILNFSGFPTGDQELSYSHEVLRLIQIEKEPGNVTRP
jgi:mono/diheme cytochrome c family protein